MRQVLCHTSGIPALRLPSRTPIMYDWDAMAEVVAAEPLWWQPGTDVGYGATTYGWIIGELIRRADGRDPCTFIRERISEPKTTGRNLQVLSVVLTILHHQTRFAQRQPKL